MCSAKCNHLFDKFAEVINPCLVVGGLWGDPIKQFQDIRSILSMQDSTQISHVFGNATYSSQFITSTDEETWLQVEDARAAFSASDLSILSKMYPPFTANRDDQNEIPGWNDRFPPIFEVVMTTPPPSFLKKRKILS